jgi:hypothetical protein
MMRTGLKRAFLRSIRILQLEVFWRAEFSGDSATENQSINLRSNRSKLFVELWKHVPAWEKKSSWVQVGKKRWQLATVTEFILLEPLQLIQTETGAVYIQHAPGAHKYLLGEKWLYWVSFKTPERGIVLYYYCRTGQNLIYIYTVWFVLCLMSLYNLQKSSRG